MVHTPWSCRAILTGRELVDDVASARSRKDADMCDFVQFCFWVGEANSENACGLVQHRGWGTELVPQHIAELYNKQMILWEQVSRRSSLSALSLASTTPRSISKEEKEKENNKKSSPTKPTGSRLVSAKPSTTLDKSLQSYKTKEFFETHFILCIESHTSSSLTSMLEAVLNFGHLHTPPCLVRKSTFSICRTWANRKSLTKEADAYPSVGTCASRKQRRATEWSITYRTTPKAKCFLSFGPKQVQPPIFSSDPNAESVDLHSM
uniref:Nuclear protein MDM1 n=1 Tax=Timema douglasi TaxID=61478 RepID=A0A7R8VC52_TIMDO|nr:unnamed protein product [Timema douglasi]